MFIYISFLFLVFFLLQFCSVNFTNEQFSNFSNLFGKSSSLAPEDWAQYVGSFWLSSMVHQTDCLQTLRHEIGKLDKKTTTQNPKLFYPAEMRLEVGVQKWIREQKLQIVLLWLQLVRAAIYYPSTYIMTNIHCQHTQ